MIGRPFSVILLPTLQCNVACDYCFEEKARIHLSIDQLSRLAAQLLNYMEERRTAEAELYWQGGEVMLLGPAWFERAHGLLGEAAAARGLSFHHHLQTNLIGWGPQWHGVVARMFSNSLGTSMDFPNRHRRLFNGSTERYTEVWLRALRAARSAGIAVGVIAVLHAASLAAGPEAFYEFFTGEAGLDDFQVNMPFPGGPGEGGSTLASEDMGRFLAGLMDIWAVRGLDRGVKLGPFDALLDTFAGRPGQLPCIWQQNCANEFIAIDARGSVALCDCWVTSYPEHRFGNVFGSSGLGEILGASPARQRFLDRPQALMENEDCLACPWLSLCHGGCPVRTFTAKGTILAKDPYCEVYKVVFAHARELAADSARHRAQSQLVHIALTNIAVAKPASGQNPPGIPKILSL
jgi:uncharacterized protein